MHSKVDFPRKASFSLFLYLQREQVYGAIAFYLANSDEIDAYLAQESAEFEIMPQPLKIDAPELYQKLMNAKTQQQASGA